MKKLIQMTPEEIKNIPEPKWRTWDPFEKKSCDTCYHLKEVLSPWCTNKEAIRSRGTSIPGIYNCKFWYPELTRIPKIYQTEENLKVYSIPVGAKASTPPTATREENINKNRNKWAAIKQFKKKLLD